MHALTCAHAVCSGILKAVHCGEKYRHNRVTKDVVAFQASDFNTIVEKLQLDLHEPPMSQVRAERLLPPLESIQALHANTGMKSYPSDWTSIKMS